jgi:hypothetical protein
VRRVVETLLDVPERRRVETDVLRGLRGIRTQDDGRLALVAGLLDRLDDVRFDKLAAVRDHGVGAGHLEGSHEQVALSDGELDRVSARPDLVDLGLEISTLPGRSRHEPARLGADVDTGLVPEPHGA